MSIKYKGRTIAGGGKDYIAGDGIKIQQTADGPEIGVETPVRGVFTQEEFDALPEEEKNSGLYLIPDGGGGVSSGGEIYDSGEIRIGTWFGKPLYRRTFLGTSGPNAGDVFLPGSVIPDCEYVTKLEGMIQDVNGNFAHLSNLSEKGTVSQGVYVVFESVYHPTKGIMVRQTHTSYFNRPIHITIEYTKTVDLPE